MRHTLALLVLAVAVAAAVGGCASEQARTPEPHHYSQDARGNKLACYNSATPNEYECVPVNRPYAYYDPFYDPFWDPYWPRAGFYYGWPYYAYPVPVPAPPAPAPPTRPKPRSAPHGR